MAETFEGKPCKKCGSTTRHVTGSKQCVACKNEARKRWKQRNKNHNAPYVWWGQTYGLKRGEAEALFEKQNKLCAICGCNESTKWCVDHCHTTNIVRGILCTQCNVMLGMSKDNINILKNAIEYLKKNPSSN